MNEKKKKILESSIKLFSNKGIYQTSLKDIALDAGISKGTLFYYYPSKDDILYEVMDICLNEITSTMEKFCASSQSSSFQRALEYGFDRILISKDFLMKANYYLIDEALIGNKILLEKLRLKYQAWRSDFKKIFIPTGKRLTEKQMNSIAAILLAIIDGVSLQYLMDPSEIDLKEIARQVDKMFNNQIEVEFCK